MSAVASALSNRQNCVCARKTLQTQRGRTHGAGCVRQWFRTAEPLGERRYQNWNTHTHTFEEKMWETLQCKKPFTFFQQKMAVFWGTYNISEN